MKLIKKKKLIKLLEMTRNKIEFWFCNCIFN